MLSTKAGENQSSQPKNHLTFSNPIDLRKAKIVCNFGLSECNRVKQILLGFLTACVPAQAHYLKR